MAWAWVVGDAWEGVAECGFSLQPWRPTVPRAVLNGRGCIAELDSQPKFLGLDCCLSLFCLCGSHWTGLLQKA